MFKRKGSKNYSTNYRGITILPVICKIIEAILKEQISPHCDRAKNPYQRGFTRNASPMKAGLIVEKFLGESKDNKLTAHLILLDAKIVSGYDQEIPQSQTADNPVAPRGTPLNHHKTPGRQIKQSDQLSLPHQDDCNTRMDIK